VTREGEVVWEYVSPHFFSEPGAPGLNNWVFRAFRYTRADIDRWAQSLSDISSSAKTTSPL
jgi:hypothetical protein